MKTSRFFRWVLPSLLVLALAGGYAVSQTITRALQLSQDTTGAFGVDANNNIYFPAHALFPSNTNTPVPTVSSGATTPTVSGTDAAGVITMNVAATTVTATFGRAYASVPFCLISPSGNITTTVSYTVATTSLAITFSGAVGNNGTIRYWCPSAS